MSELKTLQDLDKYYRLLGSQRDMIIEGELKAEAVKRAKYYNYKANQKFVDNLDVNIWLAKKHEVMEFNNLTEKDLEEKDE